MSFDLLQEAGGKILIGNERIAMVGEKAWEHGIAVLWRPFTAAKLRYFDRSQAADADEWIHADLSASTESS